TRILAAHDDRDVLTPCREGVLAALITIQIADRNGGRLDEVAGRDLGLCSPQLP
ncbi:hypothetical protein ACLOJK_019567, partial [Asimina triloba]